MASTGRRIQKRPIIPVHPRLTFNQLRSDMAHWPRLWQVEPTDIIIGQHIVQLLQPFVRDLLQQNLAYKTLAQHRDHLQMLGGETIRRRYDDPDLAKQPIPEVLMSLIEDDGGPLIWPRITESAQNAFDSTCRKLYRFLNQKKIRL